MTMPNDVSYKGLHDWALTDSAPGVDPLDQEINADRVDGMHATDIIAAASAAGGGGVVATGTATFVGGGGGRYIGPSEGMITLPNSLYQVTITPEADTNSRVGEIWVGAKNLNNFTVYNEGSGTTTFRWAVSVQGQMPDLAGPASGDISGTHPGPYTVDGLQGRSLSANAPSTGDTLVWNGSMWVPQAPSGSGTGTSGGTGTLIADITCQGYTTAVTGTVGYLLPGYTVNFALVNYSTALVSPDFTAIGGHSLNTTNIVGMYYQIRIKKSDSSSFTAYGKAMALRSAAKVSQVTAEGIKGASIRPDTIWTPSAGDVYTQPTLPLQAGRVMAYMQNVLISSSEGLYIPLAGGDSLPQTGNILLVNHYCGGEYDKVMTFRFYSA